MDFVAAQQVSSLYEIGYSTLFIAKELDMKMYWVRKILTWLNIDFRGTQGSGYGRTAKAYGTTIEFLKSFDDYEKVKYLIRLNAQFGTGHQAEKGWTKIFRYTRFEKFISRFYYDGTFTALYNEWKQQYIDAMKPTIDHIQPLSKGGMHILDNMQVLTVFENRAKGNLLPREWKYFKKHKYFHLFDPQFLYDRDGYDSGSYYSYRLLKNKLKIFNCTIDMIDCFGEGGNVDVVKLTRLNNMITQNKLFLKGEAYAAFINKFWDDPTFIKLSLYAENHSQNFKVQVQPSLDHIIPKSKGGTNDLDNLQIISNLANRAKNNMTPEEYQYFLNNPSDFLLD